jgi:hypothetical protein
MMTAGIGFASQVNRALSVGQDGASMSDNMVRGFEAMLASAAATEPYRRLRPTRGWTNTSFALRHTINWQGELISGWNASTSSYSSPTVP